jgi:hypothetical protein
VIHGGKDDSADESGDGPITLAIKPATAPIVTRLLLKMKAGELSDLRRVQTQLSVYGDRRASMDGEPAAIQAQIDVLDDLIAQLQEER